MQIVNRVVYDDCFRLHFVSFVWSPSCERYRGATAWAEHRKVEQKWNKSGRFLGKAFSYFKPLDDQNGQPYISMVMTCLQNPERFMG